MTILCGPELIERFRSIPEALQHWAAATPDAPALTSSAGVETYAELSAAVERFATALAGAGLRTGDRLVIAGHNTREWVHAYLAALRLGAIACPANNRLNPSQFAEQVSLLDAKVVLADGDQGELASLCASERLLRPLGGANTGGTSIATVGDVVEADSAAVVSFTSGTTAVPKGAILSHRALVNASAVFAQVMETGSTSSTLVMVPLFHNTGFVDQLGHMLVVGGRTDLLRRFRTPDAISASAGRPTSFVTGVPSILRMIMNTDGAEAVFGPATDVLYGGSPMPYAWTKELLNRWPHLRLHHGYGLTEFSSACSFLPPALAVGHGESIGLPAPGVELRIVELGSGGQDVSDGVEGEVWVRGSTRMTEYWRRPDATAYKIRGQWLRTGDIGRYTAGLLYLDGRVDDVINRGGEKVLPSFVEAKIAQLPGVAQVSVFGAPHPMLQEQVVAAIETRPGTDFDPMAARTILRTCLPDYAVPADFIVLDDLPRTASGKLDRRAIRSAYSHSAKEMK